jgi:hypothetical protein
MCESRLRTIYVCTHQTKRYVGIIRQTGQWLIGKACQWQPTRPGSILQIDTRARGVARLQVRGNDPRPL